nr:hypothetical protein [Kitasatospora aureofaciens]
MDAADPAGLEKGVHTGGVAEGEGRYVEVQPWPASRESPHDGVDQERRGGDVEFALQGHRRGALGVPRPGAEWVVVFHYDRLASSAG